MLVARPLPLAAGWRSNGAQKPGPSLNTHAIQHRSFRASKGPSGTQQNKKLGRRSSAGRVAARSSSASETSLEEDPVLSTAFPGRLPAVQYNEQGVAPYQKPRGVTEVKAPDGARPIVILPGFGNSTEDYEAPFGKAEGSLANNLRARGWQVYVVPLERKDWFRVARGLLTLGFWKGALTTNPGYTWYLDRVASTVEAAMKETGASQVDLVCHSAGGWLGRAFLADPKYRGLMFAAGPGAGGAAGTGSLSSINEEDMGSTGGTSSTGSTDDVGSTSKTTVGLPSLPPLLLTLPQPTAVAGGTGKGSTGGTGGGRAALSPNPVVGALVTLGTPQRPPPPELMKDMTGGAQAWVHATYPGAYFAKQGVAYVNVCGLTVRGQRDVDEAGKPVPVKGRPRQPREYACDSYQQVCGEGQDVEGDAVVPLRSAFLAGAQKQLVLPGVWHSMSKIGTFDEESGVVWYGSEDVVDAWLGPYVEAAYSGAPSAASASAGKGGVGGLVAAAATAGTAWLRGVWPGSS